MREFLLGLAYTFLTHVVPMIIYRKAIVGEPIEPKKAKKIAIWDTIIVMVFNIIISAGAGRIGSLVPYAFWGFVVYSILTNGYEEDEPVISVKTQLHRQLIDIRNNYSKHEVFFGNCRKLIELYSEAEWNAYFEKMDGKITVDNYLSFVIPEMAVYYLESGQYHTRKGVLSREGEELFELFKKELMLHTENTETDRKATEAYIESIKQRLIILG